MKNIILKKRFKKGAASFYIVAFSTLILMIIAMSFAAMIISEVTRTSNDDLAQSAYDSALAGIEDAKLAFYNYQKCLSDPSTINGVDCNTIKYNMEHPYIKKEDNTLKPNCDAVARMLGRINPDEEGEVMIRESQGNNSNNMEQYYTCNFINTDLKDYQATLSSSSQIKVIKVQLGEDTKASQIKTVEIKWFSDANAVANNNYGNFKDNRVVFPQAGFAMNTATPPAISLTVLQTSSEFSLSDFDTTKGEQTNRGMVYLVPTNLGKNDQKINNTKGTAGQEEVINGNYKRAYNGNINYLNTQAFLSSNSKVTKNYPYAVRCDDQSDYACSVKIDLPEPVNGNRNDDTFMFIVSLPYGKPATDFSLAFYCEDQCSTRAKIEQTATGDIVDSDSGERTNQVTLSGMQIEIDSTGRANNLFRRIQARLENSNEYDLSVLGPLLLGDGGNDKESLKKDFLVTSEHNFWQ